MTASVLHRRPQFSTAGIKSGNPVYGDPEWAVLADLANFANGHGGMLIPWTAVGHTIASGASATFHFYVAPKARAVERIWLVNARATTTTAYLAVTSPTVTPTTVRPPTSRNTRTQAFVFRQSLSAKTSTAGDASVTFLATSSDIVIESIAMYEQTRAQLAQDTTDYGVERASLHSRRPIVDVANESVAGVMDAYENLDARRAGLFHWSSREDEANGNTTGLVVTAATYTDLFPLHPPVLAAVPNRGDSAVSVVVAVYAKVNAGTANVKFLADLAGTNTVLDISSTTLAWVTGTIIVSTEDLLTADGLPGAAWEALQIRAQKGDATTLTIAAISIVRTSTPL